jgi:hypothetical protein
MKEKIMYIQEDVIDHNANIFYEVKNSIINAYLQRLQKREYSLQYSFITTKFNEIKRKEGNKCFFI